MLNRIYRYRVLKIVLFSIVFIKAISKALNDGYGVEIRGLGRWYLKKLKENFNSRNPATNEMIYKPERVKVRFKASKKLNKLINK